MSFRPSSKVTRGLGLLAITGGFACCATLAADKATSEPLRLPGFAPAFVVQADGKPIATEVGHAAPYLYDMNKDGKLDLLVGEYGSDGRLRIYLNQGTSKAPVYKDFTFLQAGGEDAKSKPGCCIGFHPQLADLNGDGVDDIITGTYDPGEIYLFRGLKGGGFAARETIPEEMPVAQEEKMAYWMSTAQLYDMNGDGLLDILTGNVKGGVMVNLNTGSKTDFRFGKRVPLLAGGGPMKVDMKSAPILVDWDGDGVKDVLSADEWANIIFFRGAKDGAFKAGEVLLPPGSDPRTVRNMKGAQLVPGYRTRIHVADWNADGKPDLLVGNCEGDGTPVGHVFVYLKQ